MHGTGDGSLEELDLVGGQQVGDDHEPVALEGLDEIRSEHRRQVTVAVR